MTGAGELTPENAATLEQLLEVSLPHGIRAYLGHVPAFVVFWWADREEGDASVTSELIAASLRTCTGRPFWGSELDAENVQQRAREVERWPRPVYQRLAEAALRHNGLDRENSAGNSERAPSSSSPAG